MMASERGPSAPALNPDPATNHCLTFDKLLNPQFSSL